MQGQLLTCNKLPFLSSPETNIVLSYPSGNFLFTYTVFHTNGEIWTESQLTNQTSHPANHPPGVNEQGKPGRRWRTRVHCAHWHPEQGCTHHQILCTKSWSTVRPLYVYSAYHNGGDVLKASRQLQGLIHRVSHGT